MIDALVEDGGWRTQFETGTSNGGLTAHPGGDRWRWESRLFAGAYDEAPATTRPVYGGLRLTEDPFGAAPRFGSAHLRLRASVLARTTCCYPDSAHEPEAVGAPGAAGAVVEAMREPMADPLDRYVEAHVHGGVRLHDVEALVLDPSFRGSPTERAALRSGLEVRWHPGYRLRAADLDGRDDYRGSPVADVARSIAEHRVLTPALLASLDLEADVRKRVWHLLAAFGREHRTGC